MKFITIKKVGKFTYEFAKVDKDRFEIVKFRNNAIINQISVNKDMLEDVLNFINNNK